MTKRTMAGTVTALAIATAMSGCTTASPGPQATLASSTTHTSTTASPSPSASPSSESVEEKQIAAAEVTVRRFWTIQDSLGHDAQLPITSELLKVLRDTAYDTWSQQIQRDRARGLTQVGNASLLTVNGVMAGVKPRPRVTVTVCYDVSQVDIRDKTGKSVVTKERADRAQAIYKVEQLDGGWYITDDDTRGKPCTA